MKSITTILSLVILVASQISVFAAERNVTLDVSTMVCGPDPHNIKNTLAALAGVKNVQISLEQKRQLSRLTIRNRQSINCFQPWPGQAMLLW